MVRRTTCRELPQADLQGWKDATKVSGKTVMIQSNYWSYDLQGYDGVDINTFKWWFILLSYHGMPEERVVARGSSLAASCAFAGVSRRAPWHRREE